MPVKQLSPSNKLSPPTTLILSKLISVMDHINRPSPLPLFGNVSLTSRQNATDRPTPRCNFYFPVSISSLLASVKVWKMLEVGKKTLKESCGDREEALFSRQKTMPKSRSAFSFNNFKDWSEARYYQTRPLHNESSASWECACASLCTNYCVRLQDCKEQQLKRINVTFPRLWQVFIGEN